MPTFSVLGTNVPDPFPLALLLPCGHHGRVRTPLLLRLSSDCNLRIQQISETRGLTLTPLSPALNCASSRVLATAGPAGPAMPPSPVLGSQSGVNNKHSVISDKFTVRSTGYRQRRQYC